MFTLYNKKYLVCSTNSSLKNKPVGIPAHKNPINANVDYLIYKNTSNNLSPNNI